MKVYICINDLVSIALVVYERRYIYILSERKGLHISKILVSTIHEVAWHCFFCLVYFTYTSIKTKQSTCEGAAETCTGLYGNYTQNTFSY